MGAIGVGGAIRDGWFLAGRAHRVPYVFGFAGASWIMTAVELADFVESTSDGLTRVDAFLDSGNVDCANRAFATVFVLIAFFLVGSFFRLTSDL